MSVNVESEQPLPSRNQKRMIVVVVLAVMALAALAILVAFLRSNDNGIGESDYRIEDFERSAQTWDIEPIAEWRAVEGDGFTLYLPQRMEPLSDAEFEQRYGSGSLGANGARVVMLVMDEASDTFGINVTINIIPLTEDMTPAEYVAGVAKEMNSNGYSIEDRSVYQLGNRQVGRLIYKPTSPLGLRMTGAQFAYVESRTIWVVTGTVMSDWFATWLPVFQEIARQFEFES
jgi:hypothetical protein